MLYFFFFFFFFFKQKTAYEIVPCDWSSDVCSSDLGDRRGQLGQHRVERVEVVDPAEAVGDEERPRLRLPEDVRQLVRLVARVQRDDDRAETRARILGE